MSNLPGLYHYEFVSLRKTGHQWRVGDHNDDMVCDFATEEEARTYVRQHNESLGPDPEQWKF